MRDVLTIVLAGGRGTRLDPLTRHRAKPAVPFGGLYRIIDFTLSNCINSGLRRVVVMTQYKARSLDRHIRLGWSFLSTELGESVEVLPPQQRANEEWYRGTADALYHNIYSLETEKKDLTLVYVPEDRTIEILLSSLPPSPEVKWFNPRTGESTAAVAVITDTTAQFPTPGEGDWVLWMQTQVKK